MRSKRYNIAICRCKREEGVFPSPYTCSLPPPNCHMSSLKWYFFLVPLFRAYWVA